MADALSRIIGPTNLAGGSSTAFTGTDGHTYTIRSLRIVNNSSATITVKVGIGGVADSQLVVPDVAIPAKGVFRDGGLIILADTETVMAFTSASGLTLSAFGLDQS